MLVSEVMRSIAMGGLMETLVLVLVLYYALFFLIPTHHQLTRYFFINSFIPNHTVEPTLDISSSPDSQ